MKYQNKVYGNNKNIFYAEAIAKIIFGIRRVV